MSLQQKYVHNLQYNLYIPLIIKLWSINIFFYIGLLL